MTAEEKRNRSELRGSLLMAGGMSAMLLLPLAALGVVKVVQSAGRSSHVHCSSALGSMRAYCSAQSMYRRNDWEALGTPGPGAEGVLEYARPYTWLCNQLDGGGNQIQLIDAAFAGANGWGGAPKHGYVFQDMQTIGGRPIDWTREYALCGTPCAYGRTGYRTFIVSTDGTTWGRDLGVSVLIDDFPANPAGEGWEMVD